MRQPQAFSMMVNKLGEVGWIVALNMALGQEAVTHEGDAMTSSPAESLRDVLIAEPAFAEHLAFVRRAIDGLLTTGTERSFTFMMGQVPGEPATWFAQVEVRQEVSMAKVPGPEHLEAAIREAFRGSTKLGLDVDSVWRLLDRPSA
jgi:hypothetical protein